mgnify:FL=1
MKINKHITVLLALSFYCVFEDVYYLQVCQIKHDFENYSFKISQLIWGTNLNQFQFENRPTKNQSVLLGYSWNGWEAWSSSYVWAGKEIIIAESNSGHTVFNVVGWTEFGIGVERFKEVDKRRLIPLAELGLLAEIDDRMIIQTQIGNLGDDWEVIGVFNSKTTSGLKFGLGVNSDLNGHGWALFGSKQIDNIEFVIEIQGPQFYLSCGVRFTSKLQSAIFHQQGAAYGSTNCFIKW